MSLNTVTISQSCLSTLPIGKYHYSLFTDIDIFKIKKPSSLESVEEELEDLRRDYDDLEIKFDKISEELNIAKQLVADILQSNLSDKDFSNIQKLCNKSKFGYSN